MYGWRSETNSHSWKNEKKYMDPGRGCSYSRTMVFPDRKSRYYLEIQRTTGKLAGEKRIFKKLNQVYGQ